MNQYFIIFNLHNFILRHTLSHFLNGKMYGSISFSLEDPVFLIRNVEREKERISALRNVITTKIFILRDNSVPQASTIRNIFIGIITTTFVFPIIPIALYATCINFGL